MFNMTFLKYLESARNGDTAQSQHPWGFTGLMRWYDFQRGRWNEVVQAARNDPELANFIRSVRAAYAKQDTAHPELVYNNKVIRGMGGIGNVIQLRTMKSIPTHGYEDSKKMLQQLIDKRNNRNSQSEQGPGVTTQTPRQPNQASQTQQGSAHMAKGMDSGSGPTQHWNSSQTTAAPSFKRSDAASQETTIMPMIARIEQRLAALERRLGVS